MTLFWILLDEVLFALAVLVIRRAWRKARLDRITARILEGMEASRAPE
jgi:hypothetical protein